MTFGGAGYMLEADPDQRPTLWQVSEVLARIRGTANPLPNVFVSAPITQGHEQFCGDEVM